MTVALCHIHEVIPIAKMQHHVLCLVQLLPHTFADLQFLSLSSYNTCHSKFPVENVSVRYRSHFSWLILALNCCSYYYSGSKSFTFFNRHFFYLNSISTKMLDLITRKDLGFRCLTLNSTTNCLTYAHCCDHTTIPVTGKTGSVYGD